MQLSERLNKVASDFGLAGNNDALLAIAACVLLDRNNEIALDGRDLAGTMARLGGGSAVPMWKKFSVDLAAIKAAPLDGNQQRVRLATTSGITVIHDAFIQCAEQFFGAVVDDVPTPVEVSVTVGDDSTPSRILPEQTGYGDSPIGSLQSTPNDNDPLTFNRAFFNGATNLDLYVALVVDPGPATSDDYDALTAGAVDIWLLMSVLP